MTACWLQTSMQSFHDMSMMSSTCHLKLHMIVEYKFYMHSIDKANFHQWKTWVQTTRFQMTQL
jgi:hypothetical protein